MTNVLFVCMGNICRSPSAEYVFARKVEDLGLAGEFCIESAGTHAYHIGDGADPRSCRAASKRGYDMSSHRARRVSADDFERFDYVLAMDRANLKILMAEAPKIHQSKIALFLDYAPSYEASEVPDPYYGEGDSGFELVLDLIEDASDGLLDTIRNTK